VSDDPESSTDETRPEPVGVPESEREELKVGRVEEGKGKTGRNASTSLTSSDHLGLGRTRERTDLGSEVRQRTGGEKYRKMEGGDQQTAKRVPSRWKIGGKIERRLSNDGEGGREGLTLLQRQKGCRYRRRRWR